MAKSKLPNAPKAKSKSKSLSPKPAVSAAPPVTSNVTAPTWNVSEDRKSATVTFSADPPLALNYDLAALENLQRGLGLVRGAMAPEVARALPEGETIAAVTNPSWVIRPAPTPGDSLLHLRDPRYGWLHYLIPQGEAAKLLDFLRKQVVPGT